jgi:pyrroloquinoline-quinone synthase
MLQAPDAFKKSLRDTLESHITLDHPLFIDLMKGGPNWPLLRMMTLQGYQLTKHFLTYIENLFFYCPLPKHKRLLLHNMYEEETGRLSKTKNHVELMRDFIRALGISDAERDAAVPLPTTRALIDYRMERVKDPARYHLGAAAVMIASEGQNLETRAGEGRHSILGKVYGLTDADTLFFSVHQKEDIGHVQEGISLVADLCTTPAMQEDALGAVDETCRLFYGMYDGVAAHYSAQNACTPSLS